MTAALTSWSFSRWDLHHTCPLKFKLRTLDKLEEPAGAAMLKGRKVHNDIKWYLQGPTAELAAAAEAAAGKAWPLVQQIADPAWDKVVEQQWGYTRQWAPTSWFGPATWYRSIIDVAVIYDDNSAEVLDWKTGKPRGTYVEEMELFAVSLMLRAKHVTHVTTRLAFTDVKHEVYDEFPRSNLDGLVAKWEQKIRPMFEDTSYLPRPGEQCTFCAFSRSKGGQCRYG